MKKVLLAVFAAVLLAGSAFAEGGALNVKVGLDVAGDLSQGKDWSGSFDVHSGFSFAGEYLFKLGDVVKLGAGLEYQVPREIDTKNDPKINYMPIYASIELTPIAPLRELYFKGNLGYNVLFDIDADGYKFKDESGGVYFALGAGYVFDFGLFFETLYGFYYSTLSEDTIYGTSDGSFVYSKLGLNVGYRFNL